MPIARHWEVFAVSAVTVFMMSLDGTLVPVALPTIQDSFPGSTDAEISWVLTGYTIVMAALVVAAGRIGDRTGRRRLFMLGTAAYAAGSALAAASGVLWMLVAARVLQGLGAALVFPSSLGLMLVAWPATRRTQGISLWIMIGALAGALGPTVGGAIVAGPGWRAAFLMNVVIGVVVLVRAPKVLVDTARKEDAELPDPVGTLLLALTLGLTTLLIVQARPWGLDDPRIILAAVIVVVGVPALVARSTSHPAPAIDLDLLGLRSFRAALATSTFLAMALVANFVIMAQFLADVWGFSTLEAGLAITPFPVTASLVSLFCDRLSSRYGHRALIVGGLATMIVGLAWLAAFVTADQNYWISFFPAMVLLGSGGWGLAVTLTNSAPVGDMTDENFGVGTGLLMTSRQVGGILGVALYFGLFGDPAPGELLSSFRSSWLLLVGIGALSLLSATRLPPRATVPVAAVS